MRIDLLELAKKINNHDLEIELNRLNEMYKLNLTLDLWSSFIDEMTPVNNGQMSLFA